MPTKNELAPEQVLQQKEAEIAKLKAEIASLKEMQSSHRAERGALATQWKADRTQWEAAQEGHKAELATLSEQVKALSQLHVQAIGEGAQTLEHAQEVITQLKTANQHLIIAIQNLNVALMQANRDSALLFGSILAQPKICFSKGIEFYLAVLHGIVCCEKPVETFEGLFTIGFFQRLVPLQWPNALSGVGSNTLSKKWLSFAKTEVEVIARSVNPLDEVSYKFLSVLLLGPYFSLKSENDPKGTQGQTSRASLITTLSNRFVRKFSILNDETQELLRNRIKQEVQDVIDRFRAFDDTYERQCVLRQRAAIVSSNRQHGYIATAAYPTAPIPYYFTHPVMTQGPQPLLEAKNPPHRVGRPLPKPRGPQNKSRGN